MPLVAVVRSALENTNSSRKLTENSEIDRSIFPTSSSNAETSSPLFRNRESQLRFLMFCALKPIVSHFLHKRDVS